MLARGSKLKRRGNNGNRETREYETGGKNGERREERGERSPRQRKRTKKRVDMLYTFEGRERENCEKNTRVRGCVYVCVCVK